MPVKFFVYLFDKHDPNRPNGKENLFYYADFALEGSVEFGTSKFDLILSDPQDYGSKPSNDRLQLLFDRKHDGSYYTPEDSYDADEPFSLGGESIRLASFSFKQGLVEFAPSKTRVDEVQIAKPVRKGDIAHSFKTSSSKGTPISFPRDYKGKLVLLQFWGSYSDQAVQDLPRVVAAYEKFHAKGLEILGLDVEYLATIKNAAKIEAENKMTWPEVGDHDLSADVGRWYKIPGVPYLYLVDGSTGKVLADNEELKGAGLEAILSKLLTTALQRDTARPTLDQMWQQSCRDEQRQKHNFRSVDSEIDRWPNQRKQKTNQTLNRSFHQS